MVTVPCAHTCSFRPGELVGELMLLMNCSTFLKTQAVFYGADRGMTDAKSQEGPQTAAEGIRVVRSPAMRVHSMRVHVAGSRLYICVGRTHSASPFLQRRCLVL